MTKRVIIGGVAGGATLAARLRRLREEDEILILEKGDYISYANCGLPYYIGGVIKNRDTLLLQTPETMKAKYNIDVRVKNEVLAIDKEHKRLEVRNGETGEVYQESYDTLVIATGSKPIRPHIEGSDSTRVKTLWSVNDTDQIRALIDDQKAKQALVIGGGFIGIEMAENLMNAGLKVTMVEKKDQVMTSLDFEMAQLIQEHMRLNGLNLILNDGVKAFHDHDDHVSVLLESGKELKCDLVILSIGVIPQSPLAKQAGLALNERGGIKVDAHMKTSDPDIYAVGDVVEVQDFLFDEPTMVPLAGPANKQGRIAANHMAGLEDSYEGTQGTSIAKIFQMTAASTGTNERRLIERGLIKGKDYESVIITQNDHAGYYPGTTPMTIKLLFSMEGKTIYGGQIVGSKGVDKRIDTLAITIRLHGDIHSLTRLELAYAPPFSSAKDPINMAGFMAENVLNGLIHMASWDCVEKHPEALLLDVREEAELLAYTLPHATHIPLGQLRNQLEALDHNKMIIVFCAIGVRSYNAARLLMMSGFTNVWLYPAGTHFYQATHQDSETQEEEIVMDNKEEMVPSISMQLDCSGLQCPGPIMKVYETMKTLETGTVMEVMASDPGFVKDIKAWCQRTGNTLLSTEMKDDQYYAIIKKGSPWLHAQETKSMETPQGKTIIVFSNDMDKVLASFIIANGAAAMGRPVTMFFTFWGLSVLRKPEKQNVKKTLIESMFGFMLPRGNKKLKLSKMNMGGMGTQMMKKIMKEKNVNSLEELIEQAMKQGVKIVACTMSMDVMGIKKEELIDGVELAGVGAYLGDAEESNVNLFI